MVNQPEASQRAASHLLVNPALLNLIKVKMAQAASQEIFQVVPQLLESAPDQRNTSTFYI
jgi:hypothetical protein